MQSGDPQREQLLQILLRPYASDLLFRKGYLKTIVSDHYQRVEDEGLQNHLLPKLVQDNCSQIVSLQYREKKLSTVFLLLKDLCWVCKDEQVQNDSCLHQASQNPLIDKAGFSVKLILGRMRNPSLASLVQR